MHVRQHGILSVRQKVVEEGEQDDGTLKCFFNLRQRCNVLVTDSEPVPPFDILFMGITSK